MRKLRIRLADDHKILHEGLRVLINAQCDMAVVGEADNGRAALAMTQQLGPDVVVMDVSMPEWNGLKATQRLSELRPDIRILLTRHSDNGYLR